MALKLLNPPQRHAALEAGLPRPSAPQRGPLLLIILEGLARTAFRLVSRLNRHGVSATISTNIEEIQTLFRSDAALVVLSLDAAYLPASHAAGLVRAVNPRCRIVAASADCSKENMISLMEAGVIKFLGMALSVEKLAREVESMIQSYSSEKGGEERN